VRGWCQRQAARARQGCIAVAVACNGGGPPSAPMRMCACQKGGCAAGTKDKPRARQPTNEMCCQWTCLSLACPQTLLSQPFALSMPYALCFDSYSYVFPSAGAYYNENGPSGQAGLTSRGIQPRAVINHPQYNMALSYYAFDASLVFLKTCVDKSVSPITLATSEGEPERSGCRSERGCQLCRSRHIIAHTPASCTRHSLLNRTFKCCYICC
jgi:hypothetical protein